MRLLVFSAMRCSSCLVMKTIISDVVTALGLSCEWIDYDEQEDMCTLWRINESLPTLILINDEGGEIARVSGEYTRDEIYRWIHQFSHSRQE